MTALYRNLFFVFHETSIEASFYKISTKKVTFILVCV